MTLFRRNPNPTIESETRRIFFMIFGILFTVGIFTVATTWKGSKTYSEFSAQHLGRYRAVESLKQRALDITAIYYALGTNQNQDILMSHLLRYDQLIKDFNQAKQVLRNEVSTSQSIQDRDFIQDKLKAIEVTFDRLNENSRQMTFALMEGKVKVAEPFFAKVDSDLKVFKADLDQVEDVVMKSLDRQLTLSESLLRLTMVIGLVLTLGALGVSLRLIRSLNRFLSVRLLPISNMMNNMRQSVFAVDKDLKVTSPASSYSAQVFKKEIVGLDLIQLMFEKSSTNASEVETVRSAFFSALGEEEIQWQVSSDYLPRTIDRVGEQAQVLKFSYTPLWNAQHCLESVLVVAEDVTELEALRLDLQKKKQDIEVIQELASAGRVGVAEYLEDAYGRCSDLNLDQLAQGGLAKAKSALLITLHTLKGNAGMYQLISLSSRLHDIESQVSPAFELEVMFQSHQQAKALISEYATKAYGFFGIESDWIDLSDSQGHLIQMIPQRNLDQLSELIERVSTQKALSASESVQVIAQAFQRLNEVPVQDAFDRLNAVVQRFAKQFGKEIELQIEGGSMTLLPGRLRQVVDILGHLIRNSIDHGIELPDQRTLAGKSRLGYILLSCSETSGIQEFRLRDDGKGVVVARVIELAVEAGLVEKDQASRISEASQLALIFHPGFSTKEEVTEVSGRGVGLSAVKSIAEKLGGSVEVKNFPGQGVEFIVRVPSQGAVAA